MLDEKPAVGTIVHSQFSDETIPCEPATGSKGGYVVRIDGSGQEWWPSPKRRGLVCFIRKIPEVGERIRITRVSDNVVHGVVF